MTNPGTRPLDHFGPPRPEPVRSPLGRRISSTHYCRPPYAPQRRVAAYSRRGGSTCRSDASRSLKVWRSVVTMPTPLCSFVRANLRPSAPRFSRHPGGHEFFWMAMGNKGRFAVGSQHLAQSDRRRRQLGRDERRQRRSPSHGDPAGLLSDPNPAIAVRPD